MITPLISQHAPIHGTASLAIALTRTTLLALLAFGAKSAHAITPPSLTNQAPETEFDTTLDRGKTPIQMMSQLSRSELENRVTRELQNSADSKQWFESQTHRINVCAKFDMQKGKLVVDLGEEYGPHSRSAEMEDLQKWLENSAWLMLKDAIPYMGTDFLYGGKDMYHYFPEEWRPSQPATTMKMSGLEALNAPIVVSGGHGIYYNYQYKDWRAQRDPSHGITEDFVTPNYAAELSTWLSQRSSATVLLPRSTSAQSHAPSATPWWKIGARYYIETLYPDHPEIWHSRLDDTTSLRERTEDIYTRPLFANHVGASVVFHLHTNAADPSATGTRVFHQEGRVEDKKLGDSILCSMKELIQAQERYKDYSVPSQSQEGKYAENRLANMPSILIEIGFHTNANDAEALKDPIFRTASMKGVEKGYRLFSQGKTCSPFEITRIPDVTGPTGSDISIPIHFSGYPSFPIARTTTFKSCPSPWICTDDKQTYVEESSTPLQIERRCTGSGSPTTTFVVETKLMDADSVVTTAEHSYTCAGR